MSELAVVILAGGEATRLPEKLERPIGGVPLLLQVYENVRGRWPVYVAARGAFAPDIDAALECPVVIDRWPKQGPLGGLLSVCAEIAAEHVFLVAGDAPRVTVEVLERLASAHLAGDEAVVPEHDGLLEPLAALYDRAAVLREGRLMFSENRRSMHTLLERLVVRHVAMPAEWFLNINTPADIATAQQ